jgi:uncharacterized protein with HEPN domain
MSAATAKILRFTEGMIQEDFVGDERTQYAVIALLEIIGEAASKVGPDFKQAHPDVPWRELTGLRNHLIHGYDVVDLDIVWRTVQEDLPRLSETLAGLVVPDPDTD